MNDTFIAIDVRVGSFFDHCKVQSIKFIEQTSDINYRVYCCVNKRRHEWPSGNEERHGQKSHSPPAARTRSNEHFIAFNLPPYKRLEKNVS